MKLTDDLRANHYIDMRSDSGVAYRDRIITTERERQVADVIDALVAALERAQEDVNWMLNERKFLNAGVFDYIDAALAMARKGG